VRSAQKSGTSLEQQINSLCADEAFHAVWENSKEGAASRKTSMLLSAPNAVVEMMRLTFVRFGRVVHAEHCKFVIQRFDQCVRSLEAYVIPEP